jgi:hypothetical protein
LTAVRFAHDGRPPVLSVDGWAVEELAEEESAGEELEPVSGGLVIAGVDSESIEFRSGLTASDQT